MLGVISNVRRWIGPSASSADSTLPSVSADSVTDSVPYAADEAALREARPEVLKVLLRMVLRDVQLRAGVKKDWLSLEVLDAEPLKPGGKRRLQGRLVIKFSAPHMPVRAAELERLFRERLAEIDADSSRWFSGVSWRLELPPGEMRH